MLLIQQQGDLFNIDKKYYFVHCISADYALGAGIAVQFEKNYNLRNSLNKIGNHHYPDCIFIDPVFNLVTKEKYWHKPTYKSLEISLRQMKTQIKILNEKRSVHIKYLAMPKIGCGLDKLKWDKVKSIIEDVFNDTDMEILVKYL